MQAIVYSEYGPPDVLQLQEVEKPTPAADQILVKVHTASANALDWRHMRGAPFLLRLDSGLFKPKSPWLGADFAGRVEAVGSGVTRFQPGDAVFGEASESGLGAFGEYVALEVDAVVPKPENVSFEAAAATPVAGLTALQGLRDKGQLQPGQSVLINGASGAVGTFAVQVAKALGAEVTGVCSTQKLDVTRSIGADHVIDYTQTDFTQTGQQYDLIYDVAANHTIAEYRRALKPDGLCIVAGFTTIAHLFQVMMLGGPQVKSMGTAQPLQADMLTLSEMLETGTLNPVIDRCYPLSHVADAIRYLEEGHAWGKVIINVEQDAQAAQTAAINKLQTVGADA